MNANELADKLENEYWTGCHDEYLKMESATMLRQQQAEIEALKDKLDEAEQRYWNNK